MATISFFAGENSAINNLAGSGLGFYGGSFGASVAVGEFQQTTFITNSAGSAQGPAADNIKFDNQGSGIVNSATSGIGLQAIPNLEASLNIRFTHGSAVKTQNVQLKIFDRTSTANSASGVSTRVAELIHPGDTQVATGSGDSAWTHYSGVTAAPLAMAFVASPGVSGERPGGVDTSATQHDWYTALSASPDSIGSKNLFGLHFSVEFV